MAAKQRKERPRLFVINDPLQIRISPSLAVEIGFLESVLLLQIEYLIGVSNTEEKDGDLWTYQTLQNLKAKSFPWWSIATIWRGLQSLEKQELIKIANYNKSKFDRTHWFALNHEGINQLESVRIDTAIFQNEKSIRSKRKMDVINLQNGSSNLENRFDQNETTIPKIPTKTSSKTSTKTSSSYPHLEHDTYPYLTELSAEEEEAFKKLKVLLEDIGIFEQSLPEVVNTILEKNLGLSDIERMIKAAKDREPNTPGNLFIYRLRERMGRSDPNHSPDR